MNMNWNKIIANWGYVEIDPVKQMNDVCNIKNQQFISHTFKNMNQKKQKI